MKKEVPLTLSTIVAMVLTLLVSTAIFFSVFSPMIVDRLKNEIKESNSQIATSASDYLTAKMEEQFNAIIGVEIALNNLEKDVLNEEYYETVIAQSDFIEEIEILDRNNVIKYSSVDRGNRVGINLSNHSLVFEATDVHQLKIGSLKYNEDLNQLGLEILYTSEEGSVLGWMSIEFFARYGEEFSISFDEKEIMILDKNGILLFDSKNNHHLIQKRFDDFNQLMVLEEEGIMDIDGVRSMYSVEEMDINDWKIVVYESTFSGLSTSRITVSYYSITVLFIVIAYVVLFGIFGHAIDNEIKTLLKVFGDISEGKFGGEFKKTRYTEFNELRRSFSYMSNNLLESQKKLEYMAFHDDITDLQTKRKAQVDFDVISKKGEWSFVYIDVDRFSVVNDTYGYKVGDEVLKLIGDFLKGSFNFVYRVEGDEFLAFHPRSFGGKLEEKIEALNEEINNFVQLGKSGFSLSIKVGVSKYPEDGSEFFDLLQKSTIAVRELGKSRDAIIRYYQSEYSEKYERLSKIETMVTNAFLNNEFTIVYQPIVDIKSKRLRGFECLSRWNNAELGLVSPVEFIPILERTSRIHLLDERVLGNAVKVNKYLIDEFGAELVVSVNISVETIMREDFVDKVEEVLQKYQHPARLLELEITESVFIEDFESINQKMKYLRGVGVKFSEDDFGDAYSSLTYLSRLEIDTLKISRNFLSSLLTSVESRLLVSTIVDLSKRMGLRTIVEGIEDEATLSVFNEFGCDYVQGFLFYKPMGDAALIQQVKKEMEEDDE